MKLDETVNYVFKFHEGQQSESTPSSGEWKVFIIIIKIRYKSFVLFPLKLPVSVKGMIISCLHLKAVFFHNSSTVSLTSSAQQAALRVGFGIPKNRESRKILKFGNPESRKSHSCHFRESRIPKILIPKFGIPGQFFGLIPKILKKF
jgi:hypothetical protein